MTAFQTIAILLTFAAMGSYINCRFLGLPNSIGMMLFALLLSWTAIGLAQVDMIDLIPASIFVANIDFSSIFLHGMLSFLLFAAAMHVDLNELKKYRIVVALLATIGVVIATFATGGLIWLAAQAIDLEFPFLYALLFGSLIAPTDPVAVLAILKGSKVPSGLRMKIGGESLLNDGVSVLIFLTLLDLVTSHSGHLPSIGVLAENALRAGGGSIALGLSLGWMAYILLRGIDDYKTEILLTVAVAAGGYSLAEAIEVSAPITMVFAGLVVGNHGRAYVMSDKTRKHLDLFWELLDDILNAVLFMLIGLEIMIIPLENMHLSMGFFAIAATLLGRLVSVSVPVSLLRHKLDFEKGAIALLTWGGLRGGISVAMALSLPHSPYKATILGMTYLTVVFSVVFQGTSFIYLVRRMVEPRPAPAKQGN